MWWGRLGSYLLWRLKQDVFFCPTLCGSGYPPGEGLLSIVGHRTPPTAGISGANGVLREGAGLGSQAGAGFRAQLQGKPHAQPYRPPDRGQVT